MGLPGVLCPLPGDVGGGTRWVWADELTRGVAAGRRETARASFPGVGPVPQLILQELKIFTSQA